MERLKRDRVLTDISGNTYTEIKEGKEMYKKR